MSEPHFALYFHNIGKSVSGWSRFFFFWLKAKITCFNQSNLIPVSHWELNKQPSLKLQCACAHPIQPNTYQPITVSEQVEVKSDWIHQVKIVSLY